MIWWCVFVRGVPGAVPGVCDDLRGALVPAGDGHGTVHSGGGHHLLEGAVPTGRG